MHVFVRINSSLHVIALHMCSTVNNCLVDVRLLFGRIVCGTFSPHIFIYLFYVSLTELDATSALLTTGLGMVPTAPETPKVLALPQR